MTETRRVARLAVVCAVALGGLAALLAAPAAVFAGQVTNKALQTFKGSGALSQAIAVARFNDTLTVTGNVQEPGPVSLAGFTGTIKGSSRGGSVTQTGSGTCHSGFNCVLDANGAGQVTIYNLGINVPNQAFGIEAVTTTNSLSVKKCNITGVDSFIGIGLIVGTSGGPFTFEQNAITGSILNGIVVLGNGFTPFSVSAKQNQITNTDTSANFVGIIVVDLPPTSSNTLVIYRNKIDGGNSIHAFAGIDVIGTDGALIKGNTVQNLIGTPDSDQAPGAGIRLRAVTNIQVGHNSVVNNAIAIQIDPVPEVGNAVSNNVDLAGDNKLGGSVGAAGLIFNQAGNDATWYSGPIDARDNKWGGSEDSGPNSADGSCSCGLPADPAALWVVNGTPPTSHPTCNNTPSASGGDILSCPAD